MLFHPYVPRKAGSGPDRRQQLALGLCLPHGWQKHNHLNHQLLFFRVYIGRKLDLGAEAGLELRHSDFEMQASQTAS